MRGDGVGYERIVQPPNRLIVEQISNVKVVAGKLFDSQGESISVKGVLRYQTVIIRHLQHSEARIRWLMLDEYSAE